MFRVILLRVVEMFLRVAVMARGAMLGVVALCQGINICARYHPFVFTI